MSLSLYPLLCAMFLAPADTRPWYSFTDTLTEQIGFKDASGKVRVPAKYSMPTSAHVFRNVIAVALEDTATGKRNMHYLRRDGSTFGHDSVPILPDIYLPCEEEGRILFKDGRSDRPGFSDSADRLGYFDSVGKVAIPARFVDADRFRGGWAVAMEHGTLRCEDGRKWRRNKPCEHPHWDGEWVLIDREGKVVARPFETALIGTSDWLAARVVDVEPDTNRIRIPLLDGRILSVPDIEREFRTWFSRELPSWQGAKIGQSLFFKKIYSSAESYWNLTPHPNLPNSAWSELSPSRFLAQNRKRFAGLVDTFRQHLPELRYSAHEEPLYGHKWGMLDGCGHADPIHFPAVRVTWDPGDNVSRRELLFVRTSAGYKIIEVH